MPADPDDKDSATKSSAPSTVPVPSWVCSKWKKKECHHAQFFHPTIPPRVRYHFPVCRPDERNAGSMIADQTSLCTPTGLLGYNQASKGGIPYNHHVLQCNANKRQTCPDHGRERGRNEAKKSEDVDSNTRTVKL